MRSPEERRRLLAQARLYAITADAEPERILAVVPALVRGGAQVVQLRHKHLARGELHSLARELVAAVEKAGALLIVNDHADIALLSGADGVHVGPDDIPVSAARRVVGPELLVGASASTPEAGRSAEAEGADYLGSGPAFPTPIKTEKRVIGPAGVAAVAEAVSIPVFAIGGIEPANLHLVRAAGLRRACMIRALAGAADPEAAARSAREILDR